MSSDDSNVTGIYATIVTGHGCRKLPVYDRSERVPMRTIHCPDMRCFIGSREQSRTVTKCYIIFTLSHCNPWGICYTVVRAYEKFPVRPHRNSCCEKSPERIAVLSMACLVSTSVSRNLLFVITFPAASPIRIFILFYALRQ